MSASNSARANVVDAAADELAEIEKKLIELEADMHTIHFHRAEIRINRLVWLAGNTRNGLLQQTGKLRGLGRELRSE